METFVAPISTQYELQCWGASGCSLRSWHNPGKGGYSEGYRDMEQNDKIYICVGNSGSYNSYSYNNNPGYTIRSGSPGGGATHISINSGDELKNFSSHTSDILMVAGGGGSCDLKADTSTGSGGYGGGTKGGAGSNSSSDSANGSGATDHSGGTTATWYAGGHTNGSFGLGGVAWTSGSDFGAQGGSGYYGGGGTAQMGTSGGGSGYVNENLLTNAQTVGGNETFSSVDGGTELGHSGDGACMVTWYAWP